MDNLGFGPDLSCTNTDIGPTRIEINLDNIAYNIQQIGRNATPELKVMAVVKADGYGHGAVQVARVAARCGVEWLGVAKLEEGVQLRESGIQSPILVLGLSRPLQAQEILKYRLSQTVYTKELARALSAQAERLCQTAKVHVELDTGMGRAGVMPEEATNFFKEISHLQGIKVEGAFTHFSVADKKNKSFTELQTKRFNETIANLEKEGIPIPLKHAANSAATLDIPSSYFDMIRPGIMLYGLYPSPEVSPEDVAYIVSSWTGIPVVEMTRTETSKLLNMERELHRRIVGQNEAVRIISQSIRRARAGVKNMKRPIGCFMFLGPSGVGKTQLARSLAQFLFGSEEAIVRLDMSEYMERFSVSRLTGAPPGYVGYQEGGELTEKIRRNPYSVVLLDEIEKAHPDVFNVLLQMMEDGRLSDNLGHVVDFRNTILIMTSNLGAREITADSKLGFSPGEKEALSYEEIREKVTSALKRHFRPEFLNRLDEVIVFRSLTRDDMAEIVDIMIEEETKTFAESGINFEITDKAKRRIAEEGYDPDFGARPLRRAIQRLIENPLSEEILRGTLKRGDRVVADLKDNSIVFVKKEKAHPATALA